MTALQNLLHSAVFASGLAGGACSTVPVTPWQKAQRVPQNRDSLYQTLFQSADKYVFW